MRLLGAVLATTIATTAAAETRIGADARTDLALTVYANGLALIEDRRQADVGSGAQRLTMEGVAPRIIAASAALTGAEGLQVRALTYDTDILTPRSLLESAVGTEVGIVRTHPTTGEETWEPATLLSVEGGIVIRYRDRVETDIPGRLAFADVPAGLRPRPALLADVQSSGGGAGPLTLTYLTEGLDWQADYIATVDDDGERISLSARAMIANMSGLDIENASVGLIAGTVRRAQPDLKAQPMMRGQYMAEAAAAPAMPEPEAFNDLTLYRVPMPVTLASNQRTQFALLDLPDRPARRTYVSTSVAQPWAAQRGVPIPTHPEIEIRFDNTAGGEGGTALPPGIVRLYSPDENGTQRLLGEDRIPPTARGGEVRLTPSEAQDITVTRRQMAYTRAGLPEDVFESAWEIDVVNAKDTAAPVKIAEGMTGEWTILDESAPHRRESATLAAWSLDVPAGETVRLTYRVRVQR